MARLYQQAWHTGLAAQDEKCISPIVVQGPTLKTEALSRSGSQPSCGASSGLVSKVVRSHGRLLHSFRATPFIRLRHLSPRHLLPRHFFLVLGSVTLRASKTARGRLADV